MSQSARRILPRIIAGERGVENRGLYLIINILHQRSNKLQTSSLRRSYLPRIRNHPIPLTNYQSDLPLPCVQNKNLRIRASRILSTMQTFRNRYVMYLSNVGDLQITILIASTCNEFMSV